MRVTLTIPNSYLSLATDFERLARRTAVDVFLDLGDQLQRESPVGATGRLKSGWDVSERPAPGSLVEITNNSSRALNRIQGRGPGKASPSGEGTPLNDWVKKVLGIADEVERRGVAYVIARRHAAEGSRRWRDRSNILGIDPVTRTIKLDSPLIAAERRYGQILDAARLPA
ncbi:MAG: hypothetical protein AAFO83_00930 [Cyanobacteria bacterium J06607_13]